MRVPREFEPGPLVAEVWFRALSGYSGLCSYIEDHASESQKNNPAKLDREELGRLKQDFRDFRRWSWEGSEDCPKQQNCVDCGPFVCMFALHAAYDMELGFSQRDMPAVRRHIASRILVSNKSYEAMVL